MNENLKLKNKFIFNWVLKNKLAVGTNPGSERDINCLKNFKVQYILGLCSEEEARWHSDLEKFFNCHRIILPDSNQNKLPTNIQFSSAYETLKKFLNNGITFVHCYASIERSPLICIMLIMERYNLNLEESLDYVKRVHNLTNPRNNQLYFIKNYNFKNN